MFLALAIDPFTRAAVFECVFTEGEAVSIVCVADSVITAERVFVPELDFDLDVAFHPEPTTMVPSWGLVLCDILRPRLFPIYREDRIRVFYLSPDVIPSAWRTLTKNNLSLTPSPVNLREFTDGQ